MRPVITSSVFISFIRAIDQLDDPTFRGVLVRSVAWSATSFVILYVSAVWIIHRVLALHGWLAWAADIFGSVAASLLALWLFLPLAVVIGTVYVERIATTVEHRFYPWLPPPSGASFSEQVWDGVAVAFRVLVLNIIALIPALIIPGVGLILSWMITAYAISRSLFVAVAMRRMPRGHAELLYHHKRGAVLMQGGILALASYIPVLNLLIPVVGTAAMVHILDMALTERVGDIDQLRW